MLLSCASRVLLHFPDAFPDAVLLTAAAHAFQQDLQPEEHPLPVPGTRRLAALCALPSSLLEESDTEHQ